MSLPAPKIEPVPSRESRVAPSRFLVGPRYDLVFFLLAPWLALAVGLALFRIEWLAPDFPREVPRADVSLKLWILFGPMVTQAHLVLVFFRTHLNARIFRRHPWRFTLVPAFLVTALTLSFPLLVTVRVVSQLWDLYHSARQNFGLARLYDRRAGNDPAAGRALDLGLSLLLYLGPLFTGLSLFHLLAYFLDFSQIGLERLSSIPAAVLPYGPTLRAAATAAVALGVAIYAAGYALLAYRGHRVSLPKLAFLVNTGLVTWIAWRWLPALVALLVLNFYHAWQYFGIVWWTEAPNLRERWRLARVAAIGVVVLVALAYAISHQLFNGAGQFAAAVFLTVACMHFWWDGFIWSVRKHQV